MGGQPHPFANGGGEVERDERRRGVDQHEISQRARLAREHRAEASGVFLGRTAPQVFERMRRDARLRRQERVVEDPPVAQLEDRRRGADAHLVDAVLSMHDQRMSGSQPLQGVHQLLGDDRVGDAEDLPIRARRVAQRPEDIEDGADAEFAARPGRVLHRGVEGLREHEADADFVEALPNLLRSEVDPGAQRLEDIGAATARRHRPVTVLRDARPGARGDEGGGRAHVERATLVSAGAAGVEQRAGKFDPAGVLPHHARHACDLVDRLPLHP